MSLASKRVIAGLTATAAMLIHLPGRAEGDRMRGVPPLPAYQQECASCHLAYPPGLLPAASWQRLMGDLPHHFGVDASLDAGTTQALSSWLVAHAAGGKRARQEPPANRITRAAWFVREHDELPPSTWTRPAVKSAANCIACHPQAEQGDFDEHRVRIPR